MVGLLALLTAPLLAYGQQHSHHHGDETIEVSGPPQLQHSRVPSATFDKNGRLWLAWFYGSYLYVNHSDDLGKTFSAPVAVNPEPEKFHQNGEARPKIAVDGDGRIFVAYTQSLPRRYTGNIRFSRSLDGGKSFTPPVTVNDNLDIISHRFVSMVLDDQGKIHFVWLDGRDFAAAKKAGRPYDGSALYYATSNDHGETISANIKLADYTCQCCRIAMALNREQRPVMLWRHVFKNESTGDTSRDHAVMTLSENGQAGEMRRVSFQNWSADVCPHHGPTLAIDSKDRYHMAWFNQVQGKGGLYYAHSDDQGKTVSPVFAFASKDQAQHPYLAVVDETVSLVWKSFDGKLTKIHLLRSNDRGDHWGKEAVIASTAGESDHPFLLQYDGRLFVSWYSSDEGYRLIEVKQ